jgi:hypothetical protein
LSFQDHVGNKPYDSSIPVELRAFCEQSFLLPGENRQDFEMIQRMMIEEVRPETNIEWLWTLDLVELSWEILRYRGLKQRVLQEYRHSAIKAILLRLEGAGIPTENLQYRSFKSGGQPRNGATTRKPLMKSTRGCDDTASTTTPSMPRYFAKYEDRSPCSTTSCSRHKIDVSFCCGK